MRLYTVLDFGYRNKESFLIYRLYYDKVVTFSDAPDCSFLFILFDPFSHYINIQAIHFL